MTNAKIIDARCKEEEKADLVEKFVVIQSNLE